jgi:hypothetical protein
MVLEYPSLLAQAFSENCGQLPNGHKSPPECHNPHRDNS